MDDFWKILPVLSIFLRNKMVGGKNLDSLFEIPGTWLKARIVMLHESNFVCYVV